MLKKRVVIRAHKKAWLLLVALFSLIFIVIPFIVLHHTDPRSNMNLPGLLYDEQSFIFLFVIAPFFALFFLGWIFYPCLYPNEQKAMQEGEPCEFTVIEGIDTQSEKYYRLKYSVHGKDFDVRWQPRGFFFRPIPAGTKLKGFVIPDNPYVFAIDGYSFYQPV